MSTAVWASGPATITEVIHCNANGGTVVYELSDGTYAFVYDTTDEFSKNLQAQMTAAWLTGKTIVSYMYGTAVSNCGVWASILTSVTMQ